MNIQTIEVAGMGAALTALRLPFAKDERSSINIQVGDAAAPFPDACREFATTCEITINPDDLKLMNTLVKRGDEHAKVIRGIVAYAKITAPVYWWCELETYRAGHERLASESTMHTDCRGLVGVDLVVAKSSIPMGTELRKVDMFSYQCLRNIVRQRHDHRLPEWHQFIDWVKTLPLAEELILTGLEGI